MVFIRRNAQTHTHTSHIDGSRAYIDNNSDDGIWIGLSAQSPPGFKSGCPPDAFLQEEVQRIQYIFHHTHKTTIQLSITKCPHYFTSVRACVRVHTRV